MVLSPKDIELIRQFFADKPVLRAYLFGSFARNEADEKSDVDILVDLDYSKHIGFGYFSMPDELEKILNKKVDIVSSGGLSKYIAPFIEKEKMLIYEK